ncbi:MAG: hypothetical protein HPY83_14505 [Anaerolineae bacterium]|nr:hypothetical protein [Anaerolineae bacterium]
MSRKRQTPARRVPAIPPETRARDRQVRMGLAVLASIVVLILAIGIYRVGVALPREPVAVVHGTPISTRQYQTMVLYQGLNLANRIETMRAQLLRLDPEDESTPILRDILQQQIESLQSSASALPRQVLESMIEDELVRQEAERRGLSVSPDELEEWVQEWFGYDPHPDPTPTTEPQATQAAEEATAEPTPESTPEPNAEPTPEATPEPTATPSPTPTPMTLEAYQELRQEYLKYVQDRTGMTEAAFLDLMKAYLLREKLQEALAAEVPTSAPQVNVRHIVVFSQEEADEVLARLEAGEDFAALAQELSQDPSKESGGELGWLTASSSALPATVLERAFELAPGEREVVSSYMGLHVLEVVDKDDDRPLEEAELQQARAAALDTWLSAATQDEGVQRSWSEDKVPAGLTSLGL